MIKHHPEEVISTSASSDDEDAARAKRGSLDSLEARCVHMFEADRQSSESWAWLTVPTTHNRLLRVAAHLALASAVALIEALDGLEKGSPGCVHLCRYIGAFLMLTQDVQIHPKTYYKQPPPRTHQHPYSAGATFSIRLNTFQLARGFLNEALEVLQAIRTSGYVSKP